MNELLKRLTDLGGVVGGLKMPFEAAYVATLQELGRRHEGMDDDIKREFDLLLLKGMKRADDIWEHILREVGLLKAVEASKNKGSGQ